MMPFANVVIFY